MNGSRSSRRARGRSRKRSAGFTFVELAVVVGIVALFATMVIPSLAGASAPTGAPLQTVLESDLQRARTESIVRGEAMLVVADTDGAGWRIATARNPGAAVDGAARRLGHGALAPFRGCRLLVRGGESLDEGRVVARYDALGTRDDSEPAVLLQDGRDATISSWTLPAGRTRLERE